MQPTGPALDVCPLAPAAAPSSPPAPFESPRPFPEMSPKEEASPLASPLLQPGAYFGFREKRKAARGDSRAGGRAGKAPAARRRVAGGLEKRNIAVTASPQPPLPPRGQG